jgi:hypothetical protein
MACARAEHAVGSPEKPFSDAALEARFSDLADGVLPKAQAQALMEQCWKIADAPDAGAIARAAAVWGAPERSRNSRLYITTRRQSLCSHGAPAASGFP